MTAHPKIGVAMASFDRDKQYESVKSVSRLGHDTLWARHSVEAAYTLDMP